MNCDYLIVGAGFFGSVLAERITNDSDFKVIIIDKRPHIGGNCYSETDKEIGVELHRYGTHIFHTSSKTVWDYITQFTEFNNYHHQVLTTHKKKVYQMPINLYTINSLYNLNLKPSEAEELINIEIEKEGIKEPQNLEEKAISLVGRKLYEAFIKGYTIKQWGENPRKLSPDIIARLPVRYNYERTYFVDARWQGIPLEGYTMVFEKMLQSPNIHVELNCDYFEHLIDFKVRKKVIYSGPIDRYFGFKHGRLEWRGVKFRSEIVNVEDWQGTSVMNYADVEMKYTRIHEPKHLHPERKYSKDKTLICYEFSETSMNDPFYPIDTEQNRKIFQKYKQLARDEHGVIIGGRLGSYAYYDMDKTILAALECYKDQIICRTT